MTPSFDNPPYAYRNRRRFAALVVLALLIATANVKAAPWDYGVIVDVGVIRTDNLFLDNEGFETSDTVFVAAPEFFVITDGDRLKADVHYRPEAYYYQDFSESDSVFHQLVGNATLAILRNRLFFYAGAASFQTIISPAGSFPTSNIPITPNRTDVQTFEARPYWVQPVGEAELYVEAGVRSQKYSDELLQDSQEKFGRISLGNIANQQGFAWAAEYRFREVDYDEADPFEFQRASLSLGYWLNDAFRLFVAGGAETAFDNLQESNLDEDFWEAGFQYSPNQRLNIEAALGDRSYGRSYRGEITYNMRRGYFSLLYDEGPTTGADDIFDREPAEIGDGDLDGILDTPGLADRFLSRRGELQANIELAKSELLARVYSESREARTTSDGVPLSDEDYAGVSLDWSWRVGTKTTLGVGAEVADRTQNFTDDRLKRFHAGLEYRISKRISTRVEVVHSAQEGKNATTTDYKENQLHLFLRAEI